MVFCCGRLSLIPLPPPPLHPVPHQKRKAFADSPPGGDGLDAAAKQRRRRAAAADDFAAASSDCATPTRRGRGRPPALTHIDLEEDASLFDGEVEISPEMLLDILTDDDPASPSKAHRGGGFSPATAAATTPRAHAQARAQAFANGHGHGALLAQMPTRFAAGAGAGKGAATAAAGKGGPASRLRSSSVATAAPARVAPMLNLPMLKMGVCLVASQQAFYRVLEEHGNHPEQVMRAIDQFVPDYVGDYRALLVRVLGFAEANTFLNRPFGADPVEGARADGHGQMPDMNADLLLDTRTVSLGAQDPFVNLQHDNEQARAGCVPRSKRPLPSVWLSEYARCALCIRAIARCPPEVHVCLAAIR